MYIYMYVACNRALTRWFCETAAEAWDERTRVLQQASLEALEARSGEKKEGPKKEPWC